jgi:hypothetical protein
MLHVKLYSHKVYRNNCRSPFQRVFVFVCVCVGGGGEKERERSMNRLHAICDKAPLIKVTRNRLTQFIMKVCRQRLAQLCTDTFEDERKRLAQFKTNGRVAQFKTNGREWHSLRRTEESGTV